MSDAVTRVVSDAIRGGAGGVAPLADLIAVNDPRTLAWSHLALEWLVLGCAAATLVHALRARRRGDATLLCTWATIFVYGLAMELLSYRFANNFTHAQFTVMFDHRQLPLYVTAVYPVLLYTGIATARRLGLGRAAEGIAAGLVIVAMDFPFDLLGPVTGWWRWSDTDPNVAFRWQGVPVTSYFWHLCFGGILAALTRGRTRLVLAVPLAAATIVLGVLAFLPFHLLHWLGVADGSTVGVALVLAALVTAAALAARRRGRSTAAARRPEALLYAIPILFYGFHAVVGLAFAPPPAMLAVIGGVILAAAGVHLLAHVPALQSAPHGHPPQRAEGSHPDPSV